MKFHHFLLTFAAVVFGAAFTFAAEFQDRWFYASFGLQSDEAADELIQLIQDAGAHDLNGMLWACGLERCDSWSETTVARFKKIQKAADAAGVEIIPIIWSVGYGTMIGKNPNLVESIPINDLQVVAKDGKVILDPSTEQPVMKNPDFEENENNRFKGFNFIDMPGVISFADAEVKHSGEYSVRLENFTADQHGHGRVCQKFAVTPHRNYSLAVWYKTENFRQKGDFRLQIYGPNGSISTATMKVDEETGMMDWTRGNVSFNSGENTEVTLYAGVWGGKEGKIWFDDFEIISQDLTAPVQRPGTPVTVRNTETGKVYKEGTDYTLPPLRIGAFARGVTTSPILIPEGSRIKDGTRLTLNFYVPSLTINGQTSTCMSEPQLYELFEESAQAMTKLIKPKKWFLSMDEIRAANTCKACEEHGLPLNELLGECITKQFNTLRAATPGCEVYIWSDMLDPKHNCHADYMACKGDFTGVWDFIPKELIISCWYHKIREESMKFFSEHGFRTQAAAYYDVDTLDTSREWLETCRHTKGCTGIMYTTWRHKYELLIPFAEMLKE